MIPKVIHYCWFGHKQLPSLAKHCIASWKKFFPDYEIIQWDESNCDVDMMPYTREAYNACKFGFVPDPIRHWILYNYGGLYLDTDVEIIKSMDDMLARGSFMGTETSVKRGQRLYVAPGLGMASEPGLMFHKKVLDFYKSIHFIQADGKKPPTSVELLAPIFDDYGLKQTDEIQHIAGMDIYPWDYMCPIDTVGMVKRITNNTVSIHHYMASWSTPMNRFKKRVAKILGPQISMGIIKMKRVLRRQIH